MPISPPGQASEIRGQTLTPVSPKPLQYPSPTNIPILERSMDPAFDEQLAQQSEQILLADALQGEFPSQVADQTSTSAPNGEPSTEGTGPEVEISTSLGGAEDAQTQQTAMEGTDTLHNAESAQTLAQPLASNPAESNVAAPDRAMGDPASTSDPTTSNVAQPLSEPTPADPQISTEPTDRSTAPGVDIEAVLRGLQAHPAALVPPTNGANPQTPTVAAPGSLLSPTSAMTTAVGLPPRPPVQNDVTAAPGMSEPQDISQYHKIPSADYRAQTDLSTLMNSTGANGLPPPPGASFQQTPQSATAPQAPFEASRLHNGAPLHVPSGQGEEAPWPPEIQASYDRFLAEERHYVLQSQWDKFPLNSRLFIGNLPTEKVTKRDIFHIFHKHGQLAQISIKQAYGFVQFVDAESCARALQHEQDQDLRGRRMHLEISRPQESNKGKSGRRRSRSPAGGRGGAGGRAPAGMDRYTSAQGSSGGSPRDRDRRRGRDDYRPSHREPSPDYRRDGRDRDRYVRERSRSPYGRDRYRTRSPDRDGDDGLPLPKRLPTQIPEVQILVADDLDPNFVTHVERAFKDRGIRTDILVLNSRLPEHAVVRRQVAEGVMAVSKLTRASQQTVRIPLQVFDRRGGSNNVQFQEYADLEPTVAAEIIHRQKQAAGYSTSYSAPSQYQATPQYGAAPPAQPQQADAAKLLSTLNPQELQKLLAQAGIQQPAQAPQGTAASPTQWGQPQAQAQGFNQLAALLAGQGQQQPAQTQAGGPNMSEIMAQLARYKR